MGLELGRGGTRHGHTFHINTLVTCLLVVLYPASERIPFGMLESTGEVYLYSAFPSLPTVP